jgi:HD-GYP domain-containing protein (c-di-GMP phosphodiesterase class II)
MTTARGHQRAVSRSVALRRLRRGAGSQFQAELVTEFIAAIDAESAVPETGEESPHASTAQLWVA